MRSLDVYDIIVFIVKITTHLDHISHFKIASGTNRSNSWTHRVFMTHTRKVHLFDQFVPDAV